MIKGVRGDMSSLKVFIPEDVEVDMVMSKTNKTNVEGPKLINLKDGK